MTSIAITGVGGLIGRRLVAALAAVDGVERIVGIDVTTPTGLDVPAFAFRPGDVRDPAIVEAFHGIDVLIHLAFLLDPLRDETAMRTVNVEGTRTTLEAARAAGVGHVVHLSSVVAYGAHPDNDLPLTESSALRGTPGYSYAEHKREVEEWLWPWHADDPTMALTVLRPAAVLGEGADNTTTRLLELPRSPAVRGHRPPLQFVHIDDVITAIVHVVVNRLEGAFNLCAEGWLPYDEVVETVGRGMVEVPEEVAFAVVDGAWRLGLGAHPPGVVHLLMHPWVMSADRLIDTGWRPTRTNREALAESVAQHREDVSIGRLRTTRTRLAIAGRLAAAGAVAAVVAGVRRRRRATR